MTSFSEREKAFEAKYKNDQELQFKVVNRRNKLLGLWAAEKLGKTGEDAETYAKQVVLADFEEAGDEDVVRKILGDFEAAGVKESEQQVRAVMRELMAQAVESIQNA